MFNFFSLLATIVVEIMLFERNHSIHISNASPNYIFGI